MRRALPESQVVVEHGQEVGDVVLGDGPVLLVLLPALHEDFPQAATQPVSRDGQAEPLPQMPGAGMLPQLLGTRGGLPQPSQLTAAKLAAACSRAAEGSETHFGSLRGPEQGSAPPERRWVQQALGSGGPQELGHGPTGRKAVLWGPGVCKGWEGLH